MKYDKLTECDTIFANKLFKKEVLDDFVFSEYPSKDVQMMYKALNFEKIRKGVMITEFTGEELMARAGLKSAGLSIKLGYAKNETIRKGIERLKRHLNKEDIKKIKRILKR